MAVGPHALARPVRRVHLLIAAILLALFLARIGAIFTENINWDEFALLTRVMKTKQTGHLVGGGRPGLAVLLLLPVTTECGNEVEVVQKARLVWTAVTMAFLVGLFILLRRLLSHASRNAAFDAALGVACLAMVPPFLRWSLQVRTDQAALAFGIWAGVALLASRVRKGWALAAGVLGAAAFLCTQKALYLVPLLGIIALADLFLSGKLPVVRTLVRGALFVLGAAGGLAAYLFFVSLFLVPGDLTPTGVAAVFGFYRKALGFSHYRGMAPFLLPHALVICLSVVAGFMSKWRSVKPEARGCLIQLLAAWSIVGVGVAIALFHAAAFYYFWMTIGLFVVIPVALALEPIRSLLLAGRPRVRRAILGGVWVAVMAPGLWTVGHLLRDTQRVQRASIDFVHRNFSREDVGFHPESALFCQHDASPFPTYFSQHIVFRFSGSKAVANSKRFIADFIDKPVVFIVDSWRLRLFPPVIQRFWAANYQPYRWAVWIPRRRVMGKKGQSVVTNVLIPGRYRWIPSNGGRIEIDNAMLAPGGTVVLHRGQHRLTFLDGDGRGVLVYAVKDYPGPTADFYKPFLPW
jgi:hypothetical protein